MALFSTDYDKAERLLIEKVAKFIVCNGMPYNRVYTKNGAMRATVENKVKDVAFNVSIFLNSHRDEYISELKKNGLINNNKIKKSDYLASANILHNMYKARHLFREFEGMSVDEFFAEYKAKQGDVVGVYVIYNATRGMYYVGQAKRLYFRVNQHFTGHGNGDVYADYKQGDDFSVSINPLSESGYSDIDLFEKDMIFQYGARETGYNKTQGNG